METIAEPTIEQLERELADLRSQIRLESPPLPALRTEARQWEVRMRFARRLIDPAFLAGMALSPVLIFLVVLAVDQIGKL